MSDKQLLRQSSLKKPGKPNVRRKKQHVLIRLPDSDPNSGLHRRNFISNHGDDSPIDTIRLVSPINRFAIFQGNFSHDDDDYPEKPYKLKTKIVLAALAVLVFISALSGYLIGSADYASRRAAEPPDPVAPLKPSASRLHVFKKAAVCTDAPQCSQIGRLVSILLTSIYYFL
ncbi:hypothetical protein SFRURICE_012391 [Spodoptera frugiperda]|nr:hypothetical protein SFRURICE_012391 [Spodoptera frugiperda]